MEVGDTVRLIKNPIHQGVITRMKYINFFDSWMLWINGVPSQSMIDCWELVEV